MLTSWFSLAMFTAVVWGIVPFFEKTGMSAVGYGPAGVFIKTLGAAIGLLIPLFHAPTRAALSGVPLKGFLLLMAAGFIGGVIGQMTYLSAMKLGEVSRVTPVAASWILVSILVATLFLGEPFSLRKGLAVLLVASGALLLRS